VSNPVVLPATIRVTLISVLPDNGPTALDHRGPQRSVIGAGPRQSGAV